MKVLNLQDFCLSKLVLILITDFEGILASIHLHLKLKLLWIDLNWILSKIQKVYDCILLLLWFLYKSYLKKHNEHKHNIF